MAGLAGVDKKGRCSRAGECRGDLAGDMAGLAHADDDDAALAGEHQPACLGKRGFVDLCRQPADGARLGVDDGACEFLQSLVIHSVKFIYNSILDTGCLRLLSESPGRLADGAEV